MYYSQYDSFSDGPRAVFCQKHSEESLAPETNLFSVSGYDYGYVF